MLTLNHILHAGGLPENAKIKILRHVPTEYDAVEGWEKGWLNGYERSHAKNFQIPDYFVTTIPFQNRGARFLWVKKVLGKSTSSDTFFHEYPFAHLHDPDGILLDLERIESFDELEGRLIIDWGRGTRGYHQWLNRVSPKSVLQILPRNSIDSFPGYHRMALSIKDLARLSEDDGANLDWKAALSAVSGVYLITDHTDGGLYVGSAYGIDGFLGRFREYVRTRHGGNKILRQVLANNPTAAENWIWSILDTFPIATMKEDIIQQESFQKRRLGSRSFGLNAN